MTAVTAAVSREAGQPLSIEQLELEDPRPDEVLVEIRATGICHTDVGCHLGAYGTTQPIVLGHEGAGTVVAVGAAVTAVAPGDDVVLTVMSCGRCRSCVSGEPAYCAEVFRLNMLGNRPDGSSAFGGGIASHFMNQSSFATHALASERNVVKLPPGAPVRASGPLGCGLMTGAGAVLRSLEVRPGSSVAVFGAGAVGLSAVMAAGIAGASSIIAVDVNPSRRELAAELGATATVDAANVEAACAEVRELSGGGVDYSVEASGHPDGLRGAIEALGLRGSCAVVGSAGVGVTGEFDWIPLQLKGATIRGVVIGDAVPQLFIPELLRFHAEGRFPFERLVTEYPFAEVNRAFADAQSGRVVKPILVMD